VRLVRLTVQRFQCIESAELDFAAGLNVLYGPNDLGKSSLAWAIRAVLLLQHGSALHERFVSWYGGGEPRVALTLCDRDDRYWRVTKTFGSGGAGRSILEASKDGRTFTADCSGRQVDEKVRTMLGWGLSAPGGQGPRGLPDSFLTQVLLAEQDNVRKVLFDTSLTKDPDESGRLRLTEALGALAQDPLFKKILDKTQTNVDRAFTATGRKKRSAGSPFIELGEQIKEMQREHDELDGKVRETAAAEDKIRGFNNERDRLQRELEDAALMLTTAESQYAAKQRRDDLDTQLQTHLAAVREVEEVQRQIENAHLELTRLQATTTAGDIQLAGAMDDLQHDEASRDSARAHLDTLSHEDVHTQRRTTELKERQQASQERLYEAERSYERATEALRQARDLAQAIAIAITTAQQREQTARVASDALSGATTKFAHAEQALQDARQRLRDATSGDRVQARELSRKDLENRRLTRSSQRAETEQALRRAEEVGAAIASAATATKARDALTEQVARATKVVSEDEAAITTLDATIATNRNLAIFGALVQARAAVATAISTAASAETLRAQAARLREEETALRATLRSGLPSAAVVASLRALRDEVRIAEARLGGGLSITVRPQRAIAMRTTRDSVADPSVTTDGVFTASANRVLALHIDDLVDIEVTAGETSARMAASELRSRWEREGASTLRDLAVETVEELDTLCRHAEATLRAADDKRRDAEQADLQAARQAFAGDTTALAARVTELEAELGDADVASLASAFERLGEAWQATLKQRTAGTERDRQARAAQLDRHRAELTRLETQLEGLSAESGRLASEASRRQADLGDTWSVLVARHRADLAETDRVIADIEHQLQAVSGAATDEELATRTEVTQAEAGVAAASQRRDRLQIEAQQVRDAAIEASTTLASVRARARELDVSQGWESALQSSSALPLSAWISTLAAAEAQRDALKLEKTELRQQLEHLVDERNTAILGARAAVEAAEARARATRTRCDELQRALRTVADQRNQTQAALAEMRVRVASNNTDALVQTIASLRGEIATLEGSIGNFDAGDLERRRQTANRLTSQLRDAGDDLERARGALEQVGGAIVREHQRDLAVALQQALEREHELEVEFDAWKLLLDTLRASEASEGAHLGRALAGPISGRFRQLTGGRYGHLELGVHLEATGLEAAGTLRDIGALSAGTQDQLATLLRLCVAEHLHSTIVLDDHLSHSDPARVAWFNTILRTSAQQIQIVFISCRPTEVLSTSEFPAPGESAVTGAGGLVRAIDLATVIKRFAPIATATPSKVGATASAPPT
jgi:hypothetical protein